MLTSFSYKKKIVQVFFENLSGDKAFYSVSLYVQQIHKTNSCYKNVFARFFNIR